MRCVINDFLSCFYQHTLQIPGETEEGQFDDADEGEGTADGQFDDADEGGASPPTFEEWVQGGKQLPEGMMFAGGSPFFDEQTGQTRSDEAVYAMLYG